MDIKVSMSKRQHGDLLNALYQLSNDLYSIDSDVESKLNKFLSEQEKIMLTEFAKEMSLKLDNVESVKAIVDEYDKALRNMNVVMIRIAYEPKTEEINNIVKRFNTYLDHGVVIDTKVDEEIIAGAIIEFNGKSYDYSVRDLVNKILGTNKSMLKKHSTTSTDAVVNVVENMSSTMPLKTQSSKLSVVVPHSERTGGIESDGFSERDSVNIVKQNNEKF